MCRVLLTHEVMCSRCSDKKSCGNRNETPSDPVLLDKYYLKFFLKCNQNCLKNAGNPKEMRRFQVVVTTSSDITTKDNILVYSENMFVHNNSKHNRRVKSGESCYDAPPLLRSKPLPMPMPVIHAILPNEGGISGGTPVAIVGENFVDGMQVAFGPQLLKTIVVTPHAMHIASPPRPFADSVEVSVTYKGRCYNQASLRFTYTNVQEMAQAALEAGFQNLQKLLPRNPGEAEITSKEQILKRSSDLIESLLNLPSRTTFATGSGLQWGGSSVCDVKSSQLTAFNASGTMFGQPQQNQSFISTSQQIPPLAHITSSTGQPDFLGLQSGVAGTAAQSIGPLGISHLPNVCTISTFTHGASGSTFSYPLVSPFTSLQPSSNYPTMSSHDMPALSRPDHAHVRPAHNVGPELGELSTGLTNYIPSIHNASGLMRNPITADGELTFGAKGIPPPMLAPQPTSPGYLTAASGVGPPAMHPPIFNFPPLVTTKQVSRSAFAPVPRPNSRSSSFNSSTPQSNSTAIPFSNQFGFPPSTMAMIEGTDNQHCNFANPSLAAGHTLLSLHSSNRKRKPPDNR
ncbi:transcription factor collier-like isoform X2 [Corticium candelabrum]|nr:transcription factor collier-like isoform X2 [Corticium candelabrum]